MKELSQEDRSLLDRYYMQNMEMGHSARRYPIEWGSPRSLSNPHNPINFFNPAIKKFLLTSGAASCRILNAAILIVIISYARSF